MVCPTCSAVNPENLRFCGHCGTVLYCPDDAQTVLLDGSTAAAAAATARSPRVAAGLISPPPEPASWSGEPSGAISPSQLTPGSAFGSRYRIEALLGEGGMGAVYKAYDAELDRTIALKLVRPELAVNAQTMQRFKQELLLASRISQKNILRIHDLGDWNGVKFITMAFVEGSDLAGVIEKQGRLSFDRALKFTMQLCEALQAAHDEGVVHRDLKPQNILIDAADNVYVSDFGLAKSLEAEVTMMTRTGQILGTPRYMSPEQVEARDVDHRSDLYSLGLIAFEMFTGELPFCGDSAMQLMYQRVTERPRDPKSVCPTLPAYLSGIILKCLEKDPAKRYQSAREILADLQSHRASATRRADGADTISIVIPKPKGSWWLAAAAVVLGAGLLLGIPGTRHWILRTPSAPALVTPRHYLAVLPLNAVGDDEKLKAIAGGVVDALSTKLAGLKDVYLAADNRVNAALSRSDALKDQKALARFLGVTLLVQGTIQSQSDRIAITLTLYDSSTGQAQRLRAFEGFRRDLLTIEDQIFNQVVQALLIRQSTEERSRTAIPVATNYDAYELYLQGRDLLRGKRDVSDVQKALKLFDQAVKLDFGFARAYAGIADASIIMWDRTKDRRWVDQAVNSAQQAKTLNQNLLEAHLALGTAYGAIGRAEESIYELTQARDLAPNSDDALRRLAKAYQAAGRKIEAIAAFARAKDVNPFLWRNYNDLGAAYLAFGENEKALEVFREAAGRQPDNAFPWSNMGVVYYNQGNWAECITAFRQAMDLQPGNALFQSNLGVAYFFAGKYAEAATQFRRAVELSPNDARYRAYLGDAYRWLDQTDQAMRAYDQAVTFALKEVELNPRNIDALGVLAMCYAKMGDSGKALSFIRRARQIEPENEDLMYKEATVHALGHQTSESIASLRAALEHGHSVEEAKSDPELKTIREAPEFAILLKDLAAKSGK